MMNLDQFLPVVPFLTYGLGVLARILLPYLQARVGAEGPFSFDWRFIVGQLIGAVIGLIPLFAAQEYVDQLAAMTWVAALVLGWGAADLGRSTQKQVEILRR